MEITIEEWLPDHPRWNEVAALIEQLGQTDWVGFDAEWHLSSHMLVASTPERVVGFLRYVIQEIGVEEDLPPVALNSTVLTEGKVLAFGVAPDMRRQGIGRRLQQQLIRNCRAHGCFQIRSHSSAENVESHRLKLSLGYAIHPLVPTTTRDGAYFILPLRNTQTESSQKKGNHPKRRGGANILKTRTPLRKITPSARGCSYATIQGMCNVEGSVVGATRCGRPLPRRATTRGRPYT